jgi:small subunit ribosomal protein S2
MAEQAERCGMPHVSQRWLGGMLTNFKTIRQSVKRLHTLEEITTTEGRSDFTKKEILGLSREREKLERALGGIKHMDSLPDAVFIIDVGHEEIAVREAKKLGIAVVAVVDSNCSPEGVDFAIPGNDDAMRAIELYASGIADAVLEGKASIPDVPAGDDEFVELDEEGKPKAAATRGRKTATKKRARVTKARTAKPQPEGEAAGDASADQSAEAAVAAEAAPKAAAEAAPESAPSEADEPEV